MCRWSRPSFTSLPHARVHSLLQPAQFTYVSCQTNCSNCWLSLHFLNVCLPLYEQLSHPATCVSRSMNWYLTQKLVSPAVWTGISPRNLCLPLSELVSHPETCVSRFMNRYLTQKLVSPALWTGISPRNLCLPLYEQVSHPEAGVSRSMNRYLTQNLVSPAVWTGISPSKLCLLFYEQVSHPASCSHWRGSRNWPLSSPYPLRHRRTPVLRTARRPLIVSACNLCCSCHTAALEHKSEKSLVSQPEPDLGANWVRSLNLKWCHDTSQMLWVQRWGEKYERMESKLRRGGSKWQSCDGEQEWRQELKRKQRK